MLKVFLPNCAQLISLSCSRDDLRLLGTRQRSESDDTGTRVKIGGLFLPLIGIGGVSDTSGMSQPSLPIQIVLQLFHLNSFFNPPVDFKNSNAAAVNICFYKYVYL